MTTSLLHILTIFIVLLFPVVTGERCPNTGAPVIDICSTEVKTGYARFLEINIKTEDNINNCSCVLQLKPPDTDRGQTYHVVFTPYYPNINWCYYSLTVTNVNTTGIYNCTHKPSIVYGLKSRETVNILLQKELSQGDQDISRCIQIRSGCSYDLSCSLPNNQQASIATTSIATTSTSIFDTSTTDIITDSTRSLTSTPEQKSELDNKQNDTETPVGAIIGGVIGIILVIGGVALTILVWRCYRARTQEEDNTYSSLDLQNNIAPTDVTYQGLHNNPPSLTTTTSHQKTSTVDTDPNPTSTSSYENLVSRQPTATDQNYENLTPNEQIMNHYERLTPNQQASTVHEYESLPGT